MRNYYVLGTINILEDCQSGKLESLWIRGQPMWGDLVGIKEGFFFKKELISMIGPSQYKRSAFYSFDNDYAGPWAINWKMPCYGPVACPSRFIRYRFRVVDFLKQSSGRILCLVNPVPA